jgi:hypothetical protein
MIEREDYSDLGTIEPEDAGSIEPVMCSGPCYPQPLAVVAVRGVFGDLVSALEPHTEADPVAILVQALAAFGNAAGRSAHFVADGKQRRAARARGRFGIRAEQTIGA